MKQFKRLETKSNKSRAALKSCLNEVEVGIKMRSEIQWTFVCDVYKIMATCIEAGFYCISNHVHILSNCFPCQQIWMYVQSSDSRIPYSIQGYAHETRISILFEKISQMDVVLYSATLVLGGLIGVFKAGIVWLLYHATRVRVRLTWGGSAGSLVSLLAGLGSGSLVYWASLELKRGHSMPLICSLFLLYSVSMRDLSLGLLTQHWIPKRVSASGFAFDDALDGPSILELG